MIRQIGQEWKYSDVWSGLILIDRGLNQQVKKKRTRKKTYRTSNPVLSEQNLLNKKITPQCGGDSEKDTPVTMPNTEVKLLSADGSRTDVPLEQDVARQNITIPQQLSGRAIGC